MMIAFLHSPMVIALLAVTVVYWIVSVFVNARHAIEFLDGVVISCSATVMAVYGRKFNESLSRQRPEVFDMVIIGIAGGWFVNSLDRMWRLVSRVTYNTDMLDHPIIGYLLALLATFACFHLIVRGAIANGEAPDPRQRVTAEAWGIIVVAIFAGVAMGTLAVALDQIYLEME